MKKYLIFYLHGLLIGLGFLTILGIGYFALKARQTTNPGLSDDGQGMYATAGTTLTAAKWNNMINRSAFRAYLGSEQTLSAGLPAKLNLNTEEFDTNDEFDPVTYKFTPKRPGKYMLTASCQGSNITAGKGLAIFIYKNGTFYNHGNRNPIGAADSPVSIVNTIVDANGTTDYFEAHCYTNNTSSIALQTGTGRSYFAGFKVE